MSRVSQITVTGEPIVLNPTGNTGATNMSISNPTQGYHGSDWTTNYATVNVSSTSAGYIYFTFTVSGIPSNATITGVTCSVRERASNNNRISNASIQLYSNTTAKGNATTTSLSTTTTVYNITNANAGTWTVSELSNIRLRINAQRSGSNSVSIRFYGADLTINYTYPDSITEYQITITNNSSVTVSPTGTNNWIAEGGSQVITFTNVSDFATLGVVDNNTNVTSQLVNTSGTTYTYTIENISADHTIVVSTVTAYNITASSEVPDLATVSPASGRAGQGSNYSININADDLAAIKLYDNNSDVTNQISYVEGVPSTTTTFDVTSFDSENSTYRSVYNSLNPENGIGGSSDGNRTCVYSNTGSGVESYLYYNFDCSSIPANATITSVTCVATASVYQASTYFTTYDLQLCTGTTPKGTAVTITGSGSTSATHNINGGSWTRAELNNIKIRERVIRGTSNTTSDASFSFWGATLTIEYEVAGGCKYTITNVQAAHTVVVREAPYIEITGSSTFDGKSITGVPKHIYTSGSNYTVGLSGITNPYSYRLSDNNTDVTSSVNYFNGSTPFTPAAFVDGSYASITGQNNPIGHGSNYTTNYAQVNLTTGSQAETYAKWSFDLSSISNFADIKSVSCSVRLLISSTSSTYVPTRQVQLYSGNTAKGSATTVSSTSATVLNLTCGSWTREELENCYVRLYAKRGTSNTTTNYYFRFYGATLTIEYEDRSYTVQNITAGRALVLSEAPKYAVSGTSNFTGKSITGTGNVYHGDSITITLTGLTNAKSFKLYDNNVDVTSSVNTTNWQYSLTNVTAAHTLRLEEATKYAVTGTSNLSSAGFSGLGDVYQGDNITVTLTGISNIYSFRLYDNDTDVTSSVNTSNWRYTISNAQGAHALRIEEAPYYSVTATVTYSGASITNTSNKVYEGDSVTVTLTGISDPDSFRLYDNGFEATDSVNSSYQYTIPSINTDHELTLEEIPHYSVSEGNSTLSGTTLTGLSNKVYEGSDVTVTIEGVSDPYSIKLTDNGVDVSDKLILGFGGEEEISTYEITTAPNASYGFTLNTNTGYYTSTNAGEATSAAVARVTFNLRVRSRITIKYINYAEGTYDYGIFGNIDSALDTTYTADSDVKYACSSSSDNTEDEQTLTYDIDSGEHFIDIKYRKDNYTDSNNDSLQFKIDSITDLDTYTPPVSDTQYIISDISANHILVLSLQDTITVTTSSSYNGASLSPASSTVYKGEPIELTLTVSDISLVSVRLTNSKTSMVTGIFTDNGNGTYTGILTVRENSTVTVIQKVTYNITCTDNATNGNITPTGTQSIDGGYDAEYIIETDYFERVYLKDNNVNVTDEIIHNYNREESSKNTVLGEYTLVSGSFNGSGATFFSGRVGQGEDASTTTTNYYSGGSGTIAVFNYKLVFNDIPSNAVITRLYVRVNGHAESTSNSSEYMCAQIRSGSIELSEELNFKSVGTNNSTETIEATTLPTVAQLSDLILYCRLGYYGGAINGATCYIEYYTLVDNYTYTIENVSAAHTLILSDRPTYQITASSSTNKATISPVSSTVYEANEITFEITTSDIDKIKLLDNNINVTENISIVEGNYLYVIENITGAHTILLDDKIIISLKTSNSWVRCSKVYKKISNEWIEQTDLTNVFETNKIYINR